MKLLLCKSCMDLVRIHPETRRYCMCKESWAEWIEPLNEHGEWEHCRYGGRGLLIGIDNYSWHNAAVGRGQFFTGWFYKMDGSINLEHIHYQKEEE